MEYLVQIALILFLVFLNAFFVAAEFAFVKVRRSQLEEHAKDGTFLARLALKIVNELDAYLSACQVGITFASLGLGWVGEPFVARQLEPLFRWFGMESPALLHGFSFAVAFGIITYLHIVVGEMAPKSLSIRLAEKTALFSALPLYLFNLLFLPFIALLNRSALWLLRLVGINPARESEVAHSEEELRHIFTHSAQSGQLSGREAEILQNVLALRDKTAKQIMIPRTAVVYLSTTKTFAQNLEIVRQHQHTRYPLCEGDLDHVLGMVHIKDILGATLQGQKGLRMSKLKRDVLFYPETITLDALFREFQRTKLQMAVVIDEYGGTTGIVTLEDVLEEMVGEIYDEFDEPVVYIRRVGRNEYLVDGLCPVKTCQEQLGFTFPDYDVETIGGVVFSLAGSIPKPGDRIEFEQGTFIVEAIDRQRIARVRLLLQERKSEVEVEKAEEV